MVTVVAWVILEPPESGLVCPIDLNMSIMFSEVWKMLVRGIGQTAPVPARGCDGCSVEKAELWKYGKRSQCKLQVGDL